jgi:hypothetical protein
MLRWRVFLVLLVLLLVLGQPLLTPGERGDHVVFGRSLTLARGESLPGDLVIFGGDATLEPASTVHGDLLVLGGSARVAGYVGGQVFAPSGDILLRETAEVSGDVLASGEIVREPGSVAGGRLLHRWPGPCPAGLPGLWFGWPWGASLSGNLFVWMVQALLGSLVAASAGVLIVLLAPGTAQAAGRTLAARPLHSLIAGMLAWLLGLVVVAPLLSMTLVGAPLAAALVVALLAGALLGIVATGVAVGEQVLLGLGRAGRQPMLAAAVGLSALAVVASLPYLGLVIIPLAGTWGLGAIVLAR